MPISTKYQPVIDLLKEFDAKDIHFYEEMGELRLYGKVKSEDQRIMVIKKIREVNNNDAVDISYDIEVSTE